MPSTTKMSTSAIVVGIVLMHLCSESATATLHEVDGVVAEDSAASLIQEKHEVPSQHVVTEEDEISMVQDPNDNEKQKKGRLVTLNRWLGNLRKEKYGSSSSAKKLTCPAVNGKACNDHGICHTASGICVCDAGWSGRDCRVATTKKCPTIGGKVCNKHGTCNTASGTCSCKAGWQGNACNKAIPLQCPKSHGKVCANHGTCMKANGLCSCQTGWLGPNCATAAKPFVQPPPCLQVNGRLCDNHGTCDSTTGICGCFTGYQGLDCSSATMAPSPPKHIFGWDRMPCPSGMSCDEWGNQSPIKNFNYNYMSANTQCTKWLRQASAACEVATLAAKRCTTRTLSYGRSSRLSNTLNNNSCKQAREECANNLEWCRVEPLSDACTRMGGPCGRVSTNCKYAPAHKDSLRRCLPLQKARIVKCGEGYAKAYSACWHSFNGLTSRNAPSATPQALEQEVAIHKCGDAFAMSTMQCHHRALYFNQLASRKPQQAARLSKKRDASCGVVHKRGQNECHAAWLELDEAGQQREVETLHAAHHATQVFWPSEVAPVATKQDVVPVVDTKPHNSIILKEPAASKPWASESTHDGVGELLKATAVLQKEFADFAPPPPVFEAPVALLEELPAAQTLPKTVGSSASRVHPSVMKSSRDVADGTFQKLQSGVSAKAAVAKKITKVAAERRAQLTSKPPAISPAVYGEGGYHQKHPLSVAMQACHSQQHTAAVQCLDETREACHGIWVKAYLACFNTFGQAHNWLEREGRLPQTEPRVKKVDSMKLPSALRNKAQITCAHAYAGFSLKCKTAHQRVGALCHDYATRSGSLAVGAAQRCGSMHSQAEAVCARERAAGRAQCNSAWTSAQATVMRGQTMYHQMDVATPHADASVEDQLRRAEMQSMAHLKLATNRLQEARQSGMVSRPGNDEEALLELVASHGVGLSLSALGSRYGSPSRTETILLQDSDSATAALYDQQSAFYQELLE